MSRINSRWGLMVWPVSGDKTQKKYVRPSISMFDGTFTGTDMRFNKNLRDMERVRLLHNAKHANEMREIIELQGKFHCRVVESRLVYEAPVHMEIEMEPGEVTARSADGLGM